MSISTFPCVKCGADLEFKPGTTSLVCQHCGAQNTIKSASPPVEEIDYEAELRALGDKHEGVERITVHCGACGADVPMQENVTSQSCPFCGSNIVATGTSVRLIKPKAVLPFGIDRGKARGLFDGWLGKLWFAPSDLKRYASVEGATNTGSSLTGMYLPYWTYDAHAETTYSGQRGDDYWVTETYTAFENGKSVTRTRQVQHTRWTSVSGEVEDNFDDVLVPASTSLSADRLNGLGGWDLKNVVPYDDAYLSGFRAESYTIELPAGFVAAQQIMVGTIRQTICEDIGGDHQQISEMHPTYSRITFKHILLPIWVSAYRYRGKVYRFLVNARTGQISGERPYSAWKITFAVLAGLIVVGIIIAIGSSR